MYSLTTLYILLLILCHLEPSGFYADTMSSGIASEGADRQGRQTEDIGRSNGYASTITEPLRKSEHDESENKINRESSRKQEKQNELEHTREKTSKKVHGIGRCCFLDVQENFDIF